MTLVQILAAAQLALASNRPNPYRAAVSMSRAVADAYDKPGLAAPRTLAAYRKKTEPPTVPDVREDRVMLAMLALEFGIDAVDVAEEISAREWSIAEWRTNITRPHPRLDYAQLIGTYIPIRFHAIHGPQFAITDDDDTRHWYPLPNQPELPTGARAASKRHRSIGPVEGNRTGHSVSRAVLPPIPEARLQSARYRVMSKQDPHGVEAALLEYAATGTRQDLRSKGYELDWSEGLRVWRGMSDSVTRRQAAATVEKNVQRQFSPLPLHRPAASDQGLMGLDALGALPWHLDRLRRKIPACGLKLIPPLVQFA